VSRIEATFDLLFRGFFERSTRFLPAHNCISKASREALQARKPFFEKDQQDVFRIATWRFVSSRCRAGLAASSSKH
jgi:hypothetical protein